MHRTVVCTLISDFRLSPRVRLCTVQSNLVRSSPPKQRAHPFARVALVAELQHHVDLEEQVVNALLVACVQRQQLYEAVLLHLQQIEYCTTARLPVALRRQCKRHDDDEHEADEVGESARETSVASRERRAVAPRALRDELAQVGLEQLVEPTALAPREQVELREHTDVRHL